MNSIPPEGQEWLPLACLALGVLLGLIGGLHFARSMLDGLTRQLDQITKGKI